jgi:CheY-like chemotaxis protein
MEAVTIRILLAEDDPDDALLLEDLLVGTAGADALSSTALLPSSDADSPIPRNMQFAVTRVERLEEALRRLVQEPFDVVLLDLALPDSEGLATIESVHSQAPEVPVVVLTGRNDRELAVQAVRTGAQDYLVKGAENVGTLVRSIRYAIERCRILRDMEQARQRELRSLARLTSSGEPAVSARFFGMSSLNESAPGTFNELVQVYEDLLEKTMEENVYDVSHDVSAETRKLADTLGFLKVGPRDVVLVHTTAMKRKRASSTSRKAQGYTREGRFLLLELMGYLVTFYQKYAMGAIRHTAPQRDEPSQNREQ